MARPEKQPHRLDTEAGADYGIDVSRLDAAVLRRITAMAFRHRLRMAVAVAATLCAAGFQLLVPQYLRSAVDKEHGLMAGAAAGETARQNAEPLLLTTPLLLLATRSEERRVGKE